MRPLTERLSPTITALIVIITVSFAFYAVVTPVRLFFNEHLTLNSAALLGPEPWQLVSSLFVQVQPWQFVFDVIGIWFVGATIERQLGRQRFLVLFFVPAILANLAMAVLLMRDQSGQYQSGCGLAILALFVTFGRLYNRTPARVFGGLVMEARTLTIVLVAFAFVADLASRRFVSVAGDAVACAAGYLLSGGRGAGMRELWTRVRGGKSRRRFQVVEGGRGEERRSRYLN